MADVQNIIVNYLKLNGFDGLVNVEAPCGCGINNLGRPCEYGIVGKCKPAYKNTHSINGDFVIQQETI